MTNPKAIITIEFEEDASCYPTTLKGIVCDALKTVVDHNYYVKGVKYKLVGIKNE